MCLNPEAAILAKARVLGVALPQFTMAQYPVLFTAWADRVAQADLLRARGQLTDADLDECDRAIGIPASRVKPIAFEPARCRAVDHLCGDALAGIRDAVEAFTGQPT